MSHRPIHGDGAVLCANPCQNKPAKHCPRKMCCHPDICSLEGKKIRGKGNGNKASLTSMPKEAAQVMGSSLIVTASTSGICGIHLRDVPAPGVFHNNQAVGCSLMVL